MLESAAPQQQTISSQKHLTFVSHERMGGTIPAWVTPQSGSKASFEQTLSNALSPQSSQNNTLSYQQNGAANVYPEPFGFGDLVDMVNPLQHIPLINEGYRAITGDEIKPISKIMGGGLYGGPIGAAGGLIDSAIQNETGMDMGDHVIQRIFQPDEKQAPQNSANNVKDISFETASGLYQMNAHLESN